MRGGPEADETSGTASAARSVLALIVGVALVALGLAAAPTPWLRAAHADTPPPPPPPPLPPERGVGAGGPVPAPRPLPPAPRPFRPAPGTYGVPPPPPPPAWPGTPRTTAPASGARPAAPAPPVVPAPAPAEPRPARPVPAPVPGEASPPLAPSADPQGDGEERPRIVRIEFEGNLLYGTDMMKTRLRNKEGRRLDPVALDTDMRELYSYFNEIQVVKEPVPGGVVLRFLVSENPLVVRLDIRGAAEIDEAEIKEMMRTKEGYPLSPYHLDADREDIEEAYRLRGFHFVQVPAPEVRTLQAGGRRVVFSIVEGPQVEVERVVFRGNVSLPRKDLLEVMVTEEPNFIERLLGDLSFREDVLREDLVALKQLYRREGFLDAEVALDDLRFSDDKTRVEIAISIQEHQPYTVGTIEFDIKRFEPGTIGSPTPEDLAYFTQDRLRTLLGVVPGERFSGKAIEKGLDVIKKTYFERSYVDADVQAPRTRGRERALVVDLTIPIVEGAKFRLARIDFVGNEYTRDKILRREVKTAPGGYVDRNQLDRGLKRLERTTYFNRVTMSLDDARGPDGSVLEGWKNATYEMVEGSTGSFSFGVSVSTNGGFGASIQFSKRNFDIARPATSFADLASGRAWTGAGQEFDILLLPSTEVSQIRVRFREPRFFGSEVAFDMSLYKEFEFRRSYLVDRSGYAVGFSYPVYTNEEETIALIARLGWRHELNDIRDIASDGVPGAFLFDRRRELRGVSGSLTFATVDDFIRPRYETSTTVTAEIVGTFLGGEVDFWSLSANHSETLVVYEDEDGKKHRVSTRIGMGLSEPLQDTPEVPPYERFYAGGRTLRGFDYRGVGPHVNGYPTGGEWLLLGSFEYEFPIVARLFSLVAFLDAGTLGTTVHAADAFRWRMSVGGGLRFAIPFLLGDRPLALDFGFPILSEAEDEEQVVSFSLGRNF